MTGPLEDPPIDTAEEEFVENRITSRRSHSIFTAFEGDRSDVDGWMRRQEALGIPVGRIAFHEPEAMPVGMYHYIYEIIIIKGYRRAFKRLGIV